MQRHTVFIIDDDPSVRDSLGLMLSFKGYATASFASAEDFLQAFDPAWRGCVIADIRMPGMSGLELQELMLKEQRELPIIIVTAHGDVAAARQAFRAQAVDFLTKPFEADALFAAVEDALSKATSAARRSAQRPARAGVLSQREQEVMALMLKGMQNRRIAEELGISQRTVEVHRARVMEKTGATSLVDLVRAADRGEV
jgi:FixJ family two-component response regulator